MIPLECDQLEIHRQATTFSNASGTFGKNLAKIAREADEPEVAIHILSQTCSATGCECNWFVFERIHTKKRNRLDKKRLNDLVYVQYNLWLRRNQLLNKRPDSDPIMLEDIDPTLDWVVESHPAEFDSNEDLDLDLQLAASAQPASVITSTVVVGDDDDEEPWGALSDFDDDPEIDPHDLGSFGGSQ
eukprot:PITA_07195